MKKILLISILSFRPIFFITLALYPTILTFNDPVEGVFWQHCGKRGKSLQPPFCPFPTVFHPIRERNQHFSNIRFAKLFTKPQNFWPVQIANICRQQNKCDLTTEVCYGMSRNIVGKGENAGYQHFLLFTQYFHKSYISMPLKDGIVW